MRYLGLFCMVCLSVCLSIAARSIEQPPATRPFKITDFRNMVSLSSPRVSPDGRWVAVVRSIPDFKADKQITAILVVDTTTGKFRALTDGKKAVSAPRWSPQGDRIAYVTQGSNKADQVFAVPATGGLTRQITQAKHGVQQFAWSPDGTRIAYVTPDDDPNEAAIRRHDDLFDVNNDGYLIQSVAVPSHLWIVGARGGAARRLTSGSWSVLENPSPFVGGPGDPSWSPDGQWIAFARQANAHNSDGDQSTIAVLNVPTGVVRQLTGRTSYEYQPAFAPSGGTIAYIRPHGPTPLSIMDLCTTTSAGGESGMADTLDRDVTDFSWMPDGRGAMVLANERVHTALWLLRRGQTAHRIGLGDLSVTEANCGVSGTIAVVASSGAMPPELYILSGPDARPRRLTDFNAALRRLQYGHVTEYAWTAPDGQSCDGVLTYPIGYVAGRKYPLAVVIHGGPEAASTIQFDSDGLRQPLAGDGYFVFEPNYRGSDNLGNAYEHAIYRDPGNGPASDVLSGVDALQAAGWVNGARVSVVGHSYGGYMSAWLLSHDHRWRSGIVSDGLTDWRDLYNLSAAGNQSMARDSLGGTPSDPQSAELYRTGSPITYADQITTATLILHGTADEVVPITESYALYHALKDHHVLVRFLAIPGAHHSPDDPVRLERFGAIMEAWIRRHDP
jgi:dipeptidyl aminopeptidase/acylaminoacyl peptidase